VAARRPETVEQLLTPQQLSSGQQTDYGLGWQLGTVTLAGRLVHVAGHDGALLGRKVASLRIVRESGLVVAIAANSPNADTEALALQVAELFSRPAGQ